MAITRPRISRVQQYFTSIMTIGGTEVTALATPGDGKRVIVHRFYVSTGVSANRYTVEFKNGSTVMYRDRVYDGASAWHDVGFEVGTITSTNDFKINVSRTQAGAGTTMYFICDFEII